MEILLTLLSSWIVYGVCQQDPVLPGIGAIIVLGSFIFYSRADPSNSAFEKKFRWLNPIGISLALGWIWRSFLPEMHQDLFLVGIMQSGMTILSIIMWSCRRYFYRIYALRFMAWIIVALSINVKFDLSCHIVFWAFCLLNTFFVFRRTHIFKIPGMRPEGRLKKIFNPLPWFTAMTIICFSLFVPLIQLVNLGDKAFMHFVQDYFLIYPHHFLEFAPVLNLRGPGYSGRDIRPVLEIDRNDHAALYLAAQTFERYENGTWKKEAKPVLSPLPNTLNLSQKKISIVMFDPLKGVIPSPADVTAVNNQEHVFKRDAAGIISTDDASVMKASFSIAENPEDVPPLTGEKYALLTSLSPSMQKNLGPYVNYLVRPDAGPREAAQLIERFFRENFEYSLDVYFSADESGLLGMIKNRKPAYCSFFASAMVLMLRERHIPSRLKVGFLASEPINRERQFLVRIRDAHAWVEALLPVEGKKNLYHWARFDPTPPDLRWDVINTGRPVNPWADWLWRSQKRLRTEIVSMNSTHLIMRLLIAVLIIMILKSRKELAQGLKNFRFRAPRPLPLPHDDKEACRKIYHAFETILQKTLGLTRADAQTDAELLTQLRLDRRLSSETLSFLTSFLKTYHSVRFGNKIDTTLEDYLRAIEGKLGSKKED